MYYNSNLHCEWLPSLKKNYLINWREINVKNRTTEYDQTNEPPIILFSPLISHAFVFQKI